MRQRQKMNYYNNHRNQEQGIIFQRSVVKYIAIVQKVQNINKRNEKES